MLLFFLLLRYPLLSLDSPLAMEERDREREGKRTQYRCFTVHGESLQAAVMFYLSQPHTVCWRKINTEGVRTDQTPTRTPGQHAMLLLSVFTLRPGPTILTSVRNERWSLETLLTFETHTFAIIAYLGVVMLIYLLFDFHLFNFHSHLFNFVRSGWNPQHHFLIDDHHREHSKLVCSPKTLRPQITVHIQGATVSLLSNFCLISMPISFPFPMIFPIISCQYPSSRAEINAKKGLRLDDPSTVQSP